MLHSLLAFLGGEPLAGQLFSGRIDSFSLGVEINIIVIFLNNRGNFKMKKEDLFCKKHALNVMQMMPHHSHLSDCVEQTVGSGIEDVTSRASSILFGLQVWWHHHDDAAKLTICALQRSLWQTMQSHKSICNFQLIDGALFETTAMNVSEVVAL